MPEVMLEDTRIHYLDAGCRVSLEQPEAVGRAVERLLERI
jgi:hypothetical protein